MKKRKKSKIVILPKSMDRPLYKANEKARKTPKQYKNTEKHLPKKRRCDIIDSIFISHIFGKDITMARKRQERTDIVARADDAYGSVNYAEFVVEKKVEGTYRMQRMLMILFYLAVFGGVLGIVALVNKLTGGLGLFMVPLFALAPVAAWMLHFFTWGYVSVEYSYTVDHSYMTVEKVLGGKKKKEMFKAQVKDFEVIAPYTEEVKASFKQSPPAKVIEAVGSMSDPDIYYAVLTQNGEKTVVIFRASGQALKALKFYNSSAIVMSDVSR